MKLEVELPDSLVDWLEAEARASGRGLDAVVSALLGGQLEGQAAVRAKEEREGNAPDASDSHETEGDS